MMGKANFSDDFKRDAVAQITERGYPVAEVSQASGRQPAFALCVEEEVLTVAGR
jgi:transposase-like protein